MWWNTTQTEKREEFVNLSCTATSTSEKGNMFQSQTVDLLQIIAVKCC